ncbi:hypothetical protein Anapl_02272 [Anas platyrhynchos]|uniref:Uncharacterized protein n=1 Tax=Anas platyrhynchos TaxID=8839 RepID=R0KEH2_ANAPL|nr:hypothetical protein Anapl_02272 [Anas platyrhynchos]
MYTGFCKPQYIYQNLPCNIQWEGAIVFYGPRNMLERRRSQVTHFIFSYCMKKHAKKEFNKIKRSRHRFPGHRFRTCGTPSQVAYCPKVSTNFRVRGTSANQYDNQRLFVIQTDLNWTGWQDKSQKVAGLADDLVGQALHMCKGSLRKIAFLQQQKVEITPDAVLQQQTLASEDFWSRGVLTSLINKSTEYFLAGHHLSTPEDTEGEQAHPSATSIAELAWLCNKLQCGGNTEQTLVRPQNSDCPCWGGLLLQWGPPAVVPISPLVGKPEHLGSKASVVGSADPAGSFLHFGHFAVTPWPCGSRHSCITWLDVQRVPFSNTSALTLGQQMPVQSSDKPGMSPGHMARPESMEQQRAAELGPSQTYMSNVLLWQGAQVQQAPPDRQTVNETPAKWDVTRLLSAP